MKNAYIIGIDVGGTNTIIGLVYDKTVIGRKTVSTKQYAEFKTFVNAICSEIRHLQMEAKISKIDGIGIGAPNGNFLKGIIEFAPNLPWKGTLHFCELIQAVYSNIPVKITNDANAAALGEMYFGDAQGKSDFIMITLGTGLGSGIVSNGKIIYGHDSYAGEIGHTNYMPEGRLCGCGRKGCLEAYVSAGGIVKTALEMLQESSFIKSVLLEIPTDSITPLDISREAKNGDKIALDVFETTARILALKLADSVAYTSPSTIYIFGGIANAGDILMSPLKTYFEYYLLSIYKNKVELKFSALPQNDAAILGASALVMGNY